jgi:hypothetical protein
MSAGPRRLIYHRDLAGWECFEPPLDIRDLVYDYVGRIAGTQVDTFVLHLTYNLFPSRLTVETFASETGAPVGLEGDHATGAAPGTLSAASWRKLENERHLREAGIDPVALLLGACREAGLSFFAGVRMNDVHHAQYPWHPRFWIEHPECRLGEHPEYRLPRVGYREPGGAFAASIDDRPPACLDYGCEAVRAYRLAYIVEIAERYPEIDGIELDFTRHPFYFKPKEVAAGIGLMTTFLASLRDRLQTVAKARGRALVLEARVPPTLAACRRIGLDVARWMEERLIDIVVPAPYWHPDFGMPIEEFTGPAHRSGCAVFPSIECAEMPVYGGSEQTAEVVRAAAAAWWAAGADGIHVFNTHVFTYYLRQEMPFLRDIADPRLLLDRTKRYVVTRSSNYDDAAWFSYPKQLPAVLRPGSSATAIALRIGDDLEAAGRLGLRPQATARVRVRNLTSVDALEVRLNGARLDPATMRSTFYPMGEAAALRQYPFIGDTQDAVDGPYHWFEFPLPEDRLPRRGMNTIEVKLHSLAPGVTSDVILNDVEMIVAPAKREGAQPAAALPRNAG